MAGVLTSGVRDLERTMEFLDADVHGNCGAREKRHAAEMRRVRTKVWMQKQAEEEECVQRAQKNRERLQRR